MQAEVEHEGGRYALTSGSWFRIDKNYLKEIEDFVRAMDDVSHELPLPNWDKQRLKEDESDKTAEGSYNKIVAKTLGCELLDKRIYISDSTVRSKYVIC